jgi:hypothetical protein
MSNFETDRSIRARARSLWTLWAETEANKPASADAKNEKVYLRGPLNVGLSAFQTIEQQSIPACAMFTPFPTADSRRWSLRGEKGNPRDWPPSRNIDPSRELSKRTLEMQRSAT